MRDTERNGGADAVILPMDWGDGEALRRAALVVAAAYAGEAETLGLSAETCPTHPAFAGERHLATAAAMQNVTAYALFDPQGDMAGFLMLRTVSGGKLEIMRLCVPPAHRGRGYGAKLQQFAEICARAWRCGKLVLNIAADNREFEGWYTRHGYTMTGSFRMHNVPYRIGFLEKPL